MQEHLTPWSLKAARKYDDDPIFSDDFDFPPTDHPRRELSTASVFVLALLVFIVWGGWKLISLILTALV
jgi:hypothetical protein